MKTRLIMNSLQAIMQIRNLGTNMEVQKYIDGEVIRLSHPFTPFENGGLIGSGLRATNIGEGLVEYNAPYAKRLYYNPQYNFQGAPTRGGLWFERMKAQHVKNILEGAAKIAGGRGE